MIIICAVGGHLELVKYLIHDCGASVSKKTTYGGTALWWARRVLEAEDPVIRFLEEIDAPDEGKD